MKKWKCSVCGYIHVGEEPPEECPVCGADSSKFEELTEELTGQAQPEQVEKSSGGSGGSGFDKLANVILQNHLHPIAVHTPNGIVPVAALFLFLAVAFKMSSFEIPAFYNFVCVFLAMPFVLFSGYIEWQRHYNGVKTSVFLVKISCGIMVMAGVTVLVAWRYINPEVAAPDSSVKWIYLLLCIILLAPVGLAGHLGGKLVFGRKK